MGVHINKIIKSLTSFSLVLALLAFQLVPLGAFWNNTASAAPVCTNDQQGANDEPGQKDLTLMCFDNAGLPTTVTVNWQWDETAWSGNNTGDGCALFDSDNDGDANYAFCVIVGGNPAAQIAGSPKVYSCNDTREDRCAGKQLINKVYTSTCTVTTGTDPFPAGSGFPNDTRANCSINLSDFSTSQAPQTIVLKDVCSYPSQEPNSDPSDCIIATTNKTTTIEVVKNVVPNTDTSTFDLYVGANLLVDNGPHGSTTGAVAINDKADITIKEAAGSNAVLGDFTTTVSCKDQSNDTVPTTAITGTTTREVTIDSSDIGEGDNIKCTFTNTRKNGSIKLIKSVTNNNGGTAGVNDFGLSTGGTAVTSGQVLSLPPGQYAINEAGLAGYQFVSITGTGCPSLLGGLVTLASNQNIVCTITNDDIAPTLTVVKNVVNDNGGTATVGTFGITKNGNSLTFDAGTPNGTTTTYTANPTVQANAAYSLSELDISGYVEGTWSCSDNTIGTGRSVSVTLALDEDVTCTVTNNDVAAKITVIKYVTNNDGGELEVEDFPLFVGDVQVTSGVQNNFNAGLYVVSETNQFGYAAGDWGGACAPDGSITLEVGGVYTCTITNNDKPAKIKVTKVVVNDNGGDADADDFTLKVNTTNVVSGVNNTFDGNESYTISETNTPSGYTQTSIVCYDVTGDDVLVANPFTALNGRSYECTVTNDDVAPSLTVVKKVVNDNGGTAVVSDFDLEINNNNLSFGTGSVNGNETTYTSTPAVVANTGYTLSELDLGGYTEGTWSCTDGSQPSGLNVAVNLDEGENVTCTITNNDKQGELVLIKKVVNDNGGDASQSAWTLNADGPTDVSGNDNTESNSSGYNTSVNAGTYDLSETNGPSGYALESIKCGTSLENLTTAVNDQVQVSNGQKVYCVFKNNDIAPKLTLKKHVVNDNGGEAESSDWILTANPIIGTSISGNGDDGVVDEDAVANVSYELSESGPDGYAVSIDWDCDGGGTFDADKNTITLDEGDDVTCEITNNDIAPKLTIIKKINGIDSEETFAFNGGLGEFTLGHGDSETKNNLNVGEYEVAEVNKTGWKLGSVNCYGTQAWGAVYDDNLLTGVKVDLELADDVTCKFKNDKLGEISGHKFEDTDGDGYAWEDGEPALEGWTIQLIKTCQNEAALTLAFLDNIVQQDCLETVVDETVTDENGSYSFENIDFGNYKVCEVQQTGWVQTYPGGDGCKHLTIWRSGQVKNDIDFGNFENGQVSGFKFNDYNSNGVYDEGEEKLSGWTITLTKHCDEEIILLSLRDAVAECEDETTSTVTDENGNYSFNDLEMGSYTVCEVQQNGWTRTYPAASDCHEFEINTSGQREQANFGNKAQQGQVLGELVNTGSPLQINVAISLVILLATLGITFASRRTVKK